jgi:hypothetical protein
MRDSPESVSAVLGSQQQGTYRLFEYLFSRRGIMPLLLDHCIPRSGHGCDSLDWEYFERERSGDAVCVRGVTALLPGTVQAAWTTPRVLRRFMVAAAGLGGGPGLAMGRVLAGRWAYS